jgi:hypothetical protein
MFGLFYDNAGHYRHEELTTSEPCTCRCRLTAFGGGYSAMSVHVISKEPNLIRKCNVNHDLRPDLGRELNAVGNKDEVSEMRNDPAVLMC